MSPQSRRRESMRAIFRGLPAARLIPIKELNTLKTRAISLDALYARERPLQNRFFPNHIPIPQQPQEGITSRQEYHTVQVKNNDRQCQQAEAGSSAVSVSVGHCAGPFETDFMRAAQMSMKSMPTESNMMWMRPGTDGPRGLGGFMSGMRGHDGVMDRDFGSRPSHPSHRSREMPYSAGDGRTEHRPAPGPDGARRSPEARRQCVMERRPGLGAPGFSSITAVP